MVYCYIVQIYRYCVDRYRLLAWVQPFICCSFFSRSAIEQTRRISVFNERLTFEIIYGFDLSKQSQILYIGLDMIIYCWPGTDCFALVTDSLMIFLQNLCQHAVIREAKISFFALSREVRLSSLNLWLLKIQLHNTLMHNSEMHTTALYSTAL